MPSVKCQSCNNRTLDPSGLCHLHIRGNGESHGSVAPSIPKLNHSVSGDSEAEPGDRAQVGTAMNGALKFLEEVNLDTLWQGSIRFQFAYAYVNLQSELGGAEPHGSDADLIGKVEKMGVGNPVNWFTGSGVRRQAITLRSELRSYLSTRDEDWARAML